MWHAEALLTNFKGKDWEVNKSSDFKILLGIHAHIFAPNKIQRRGSGLGKGWKNYFVRPATNTTPHPPPLISGSAWLGPPPLFWRSGSATAEVEALWLLFIKWMNFLILSGSNQAFGRAGNWGEGKAKRPVDKHLGPPFHGTHCASDPDASSYWWEHWLLTGLIDICFSVST